MNAPVTPRLRAPTRSDDPYRVPRPAVISFSGGRTSAYLLGHIVDAYGGRLPPDVHVVFANTGREMPATLDFVNECAKRWDVPIAWVEYRWDAPHHTHYVTRASASRDGEPFAALIRRKGWLPNATMRSCTGWLKSARIEAHARHTLGLKSWHAVIGLRHDEPSRVARMRARDCGSSTGAHAVLPLDDARVVESDVLAYWKAQPFDLSLDGYAGNCDLCFLKKRAKLLHLIRERPQRADWWIAQEDAAAVMDTRLDRFRKSSTRPTARCGAPPSTRATCSSTPPGRTTRRRRPTAPAPTEGARPTAPRAGAGALGAAGTRGSGHRTPSRSRASRARPGRPPPPGAPPPGCRTPQAGPAAAPSRRSSHDADPSRNHTETIVSYVAERTPARGNAA